MKSRRSLATCSSGVKSRCISLISRCCWNTSKSLVVASVVVVVGTAVVVVVNNLGAGREKMSGRLVGRAGLDPTGLTRLRNKGFCWNLVAFGRNKMLGSSLRKLGTLDPPPPGFDRCDEGSPAKEEIPDRKRSSTRGFLIVCCCSCFCSAAG